MLRPLRSWKPLSDVMQLDTPIATLSAVDDPFFTRTHVIASTFPPASATWWLHATRLFCI